MANLKDIKRRIVSVKNTQQITKAMKLVAAARLRKAQEVASRSRPYSVKIQEMIKRLAPYADSEDPIYHGRREGCSLIIICSADKGLCGPFNSNIFKESDNILANSSDAKLLLIGRKGIDRYKNSSFEIIDRIYDYNRNLTVDFATNIAKITVSEYMSSDIKEVYLIYNHFKNVVTQTVQRLTLLPLDIEGDTELVERGSASSLKGHYEFEPSKDKLLKSLAREYINNQIYHALLESAASENGARMTAMDAATNNAKEMISTLTLTYNRARQAAITTEIIEIVSGAEALN
ncbi:MAG: ATP synthase F1 subunit gamma [Nitrospinota bacterium]